MKALYGILEDKERELRDFIRNYEQRMRENEATLGRFQQQKGGMSSEERERERERGRWRLLRAVGNEADRSLSLAACLADKEVALSHARATIKELQRQLMEGGGGGGGGGGGARLSDQATPGAGSNSCGGVSGIIPHIDSQPPSGTTELGMTSNTSGGVTYAISSGGHAGDRGRCSADSGVRGSGDGESGGATSIGGNLSDSTTDVAALNDNGATSNSDLGSGGMINGNNNGSSPAFSGIGNTNLCQEENESQTHAQEDGKRLRTVLIAAQLRREVRPATSHSPCGSPGEKTRRSCALNRDKTRLGESRSRSSCTTDPETDVRKEIADNDVRPEEENEPGPGSRPASAANSLGICDDSVGAKLRRLLLTGAARGEIGTEDAALEEEARFVALEMELQHAREALHALKADRKRFKVEKFDLIQGFIFTFFFMLRLIERNTLLEQSCN
ncbi:kazrin isoform X1 [Vespula squamosa]|uniref:Kazrin isoform X1 n=1 Tax=Vespula squamosa TaxID=30214 RepID=A0ABD1ZTF7_VESSQ